MLLIFKVLSSSSSSSPSSSSSTTLRSLMEGEGDVITFKGDEELVSKATFVKVVVVDEISSFPSRCADVKVLKVVETISSSSFKNCLS